MHVNFLFKRFLYQLNESDKAKLIETESRMLVGAGVWENWGDVI